MLEFNDIFQLLMLVFVGIITSIQLYLLISNLKKPKNNIGSTIPHPPNVIPNLPTPFATNVNI